MTNTTNESEAMEVARNVLGRLLACKLANLDELRTEAEVARVIATALEARDARIAELEGALEQAAHNLETGDRFYKCPGLHRAAQLARAILTKGNTHD